MRDFCIKIMPFFNPLKTLLHLTLQSGFLNPLSDLHEVYQYKIRKPEFIQTLNQNKCLTVN